MSNELTNGSKKMNKEKNMGSGTPLTDPRRLGRRKRARTLRLALLSSLIGMLTLASLPAHAALITINETMDISELKKYHYLHQPITPRTIAAGDSVDITVNFSDGQAIRVSNNSLTRNETFEISLRSHDTSDYATFENPLITFLGFSQNGSASSVISKKVTNLYNCLLGPIFYNYPSQGQFIQFTGYNLTYDVTYSTNTKYYSNLQFYIDSSDLAVVSVAVPEPGALSLLTIGLAGLIALWRKKCGPGRGVYPV